MGVIEVAVPDGMSVDTARRLTSSLFSNRVAVERVVTVLERQPEPLGPATAAMLATVDQRWRDIIDRYGVYTAADIATLRGASPTNRSLASKMQASHGLVGFRRGRTMMYPVFQFDGPEVRPLVKQVTEPLRAAEWEDEDIVLWLAAPNGDLDGRAPVDALDDPDPTALLNAVQYAAAGAW